MSMESLSWAKRQRTGSPTLKAVLLAVADYADDTGCAWPSQVQLAADTELKERAVRGALAELEARGFLKRTERRRKDKTRKSDLIHLNYEHQAVCAAASDNQPARDAGSPEQAARDAGRSTGTWCQDQPARGAGPTTFEPSIVEPSVGKKETHASARAADGWDFAEFWHLYPHKVAKRTAQGAFEAARRRAGVPFARVLDGLQRYMASKPPDRLWRNPATWLNGDAWLDEPAPAQGFAAAADRLLAEIDILEGKNHVQQRSSDRNRPTWAEAARQFRGAQSSSAADADTIEGDYIELPVTRVGGLFGTG